MARSTRMVVVAVAVILISLIALSAAMGWTQTPPDDGRLPEVARTTLQGEVEPDPLDGEDPASLAPTPAGSECLDRIERPAGGLDLCWQVYRERRESDPAKDYYRLRVFGSFGWDSGSGIRWVAVRAEPTEAGFVELMDTWPIGVFQGECQQVEVAVGPGPVTAETVCGRTTASTPAESGSQRVDWTCSSCLFPDQMTRAIALYEFVAVPAGTVPSWRIFADLGG